MQIILPKNVNKIIHVLEEHGFQVCGGRLHPGTVSWDGRPGWDIDLGPSGAGERSFQKNRRYGNQHGTVTIPSGRGGLRGDDLPTGREYEDSRHPKEVTFTSPSLEDLKRRDFYDDERHMAPAEKNTAWWTVPFRGPEGLFEEKVASLALTIHWKPCRTSAYLPGVFAAQLGFSIEEESQEVSASRPSGAHVSQADSDELICFSPSRGVLYGL